MLLRELIQKYPNDSFDMMTPGGFVFLTPVQAKALLAGESVMAHPGDPECSTRISAENLLSQKILSVRRQNHVCHMLTDEAEKEEQTENRKEVEGMQEQEKERKLKERLKSNYEAYIQQLKQKPASDLIEMASEIAGARIVYEEIAMVGGFSKYADYLLQFDNPLELILDNCATDLSEQHENLELLIGYMADEGIGMSKGFVQEDGSAPTALEQGVTMC